MRNIVMIFGLCLLCGVAGAQVAVGGDYTTAQIQTIISDSSAAEGDIYHDSQTDAYYIGTTSGALNFLSNFKLKQVSNELTFEDANYYYVSMQIGVGDYKVVRYDKLDVNIEEVSVGTGVQPASLVAVQGLVYL